MRQSTVLATTFLALAVFTRISTAGVGITPKIGTLGYGGDLTVGIVRTLNARIGLNMFDYTIERTEDEDTSSSDEISVKIDFQTIPILLDWHPWNSPFRITGGMVVNNNKVDLYARPGDTVTFNDHDYTVSSVDGSVSFKKMAPYMGIGSGDAADRSGHWHFAFDLGVMFQGSPEIDLTAVSSEPMFQGLLNADVEEKRREIEDDAKPFNIYPVISLGVSFTF